MVLSRKKAEVISTSALNVDSMQGASLPLQILLLSLHWQEKSFPKQTNKHQANLKNCREEQSFFLKQKHRENQLCFEFWLILLTRHLFVSLTCSIKTRPAAGLSHDK